MRKICVVLLFLCASPVFGAVVTVGCPGGSPGTYPSINAALAALDTQGPNTINVSGTCTESVNIDQRERLTIQGPATVTGTANFGIQILNSGNVTLRNLTVTGPQNAIAVANRSAATIVGVTAQGGFNALDVFGGASVNVGGFTAADAVLLHNSGNGIRMEGSVVFMPARVTIENNSGAGLLIDAGRVETSAPAAGPIVIRNNGSPTDEFRSGISASHGSMVWFGGGQIINNTGRGILADSGANVRIDNATVSGNSEVGMLLKHGVILESIGGNTVPDAVTCDATTIVFGDFTGFAPFECEKKDKEK